MKVLILLAAIGCVAILIDARATRNKRYGVPSFLGGGDCKDIGTDCDGIPSCCGDLVCYWENGISALRDGVCVDCIKENQKCQRDKHCCRPLACIKEKLFHLNGVCKRKLEQGEHCHDDDDCLSANCNREYMISLHGKCG